MSQVGIVALRSKPWDQIWLTSYFDQVMHVSCAPFGVWACGSTFAFVASCRLIRGTEQCFASEPIEMDRDHEDANDRDVVSTLPEYVFRFLGSYVVDPSFVELLPVLLGPR